MKKGDLILVIFFLFLVQVLCCWNIDISVSAMLTGPDAYLTNGWSDRSPMLMYHIGLYGLILSGFMQIMIGVYIILKEEKQ